MARVHSGWSIPLGLFLACTAGCRAVGTGSSHPPIQTANTRESTMPASDSVHPDVLKRFCGRPPGPAPLIVTILKDSSGRIGGYTYTREVADSPIFYLDARGNEYAMFHIFGSDEEKAKNQVLIDALRKDFPLESPLECP